MKTVGALIIVMLAVGLMTSGVGVYAIVGSDDSVDASPGDVKITSAAGGCPQPGYDSGWVATPFGSPGQTYQKQLTHGLSGSVDDYTVDLQVKYTTIAGPQPPTNQGIGTTFYYTGLTTNSITLWGPGSAIDAGTSLRVRIWVCSPAAGCPVDFAQYKPVDEGFFPSTIRAGQTLYMTFGGANEGTEAIAPGWRIRYYACRTPEVHRYNGDYDLYETTADFGISPGAQRVFTEAFVFPTKDLHGRTISPGHYYIGWYYDPDDELCESNENNNAGCITSAMITVVSP
jgi:hypothetical protein